MLILMKILKEFLAIINVVMNLNNKEYSKMVKKESPRSPFFLDTIKAFLVGGAICALGQGLVTLYTNMGAQQKDAKTLCSVSLVLFGVLLTIFGVYDKLAKHAGAGTLVPITGFANSIAAPAIEFKSEGFILGVGAKIFTIAGPVIVYGTLASVIYGLVYWLGTLL